jgi:competence protein ComFC
VAKVRVAERFLNLLFPSRCPFCEGPSSSGFYPFCRTCWQDIRPFAGNRCSICSIPLAEGPSICGECTKERPSYYKSYVYGIYDGKLKEAINYLKYHKIRGLARPLADLLLRIPLPDADIILPVPPDPERLKKREFNHTSLIARYLSKRLGIPLGVNLLRKIKSTPPQANLKRIDRIRNLRGAFKVFKDLTQKRVILVDDVITTGATIEECSRALKRAGAEFVYIVAIARSGERVTLLSVRDVDFSETERLI